MVIDCKYPGPFVGSEERSNYNKRLQAGGTRKMTLEKIVREEIRKRLNEELLKEASPVKTKSHVNPQPGDPNRASFIEKELKRLAYDIPEAYRMAYKLGGLGHGIVVSLENYQKLLQAELAAASGANL